MVENDVPEEMKYAIVIAVEIDYPAIQCAPAHPASAAASLGYSKMAFIAGLLVQYIRGLGYQAIPCGNDTACSIPLAIDAGLGELGRNGLWITPPFGPRVRLAKVLTNLPLVPDRPVAFGDWEFCKICGKCAERCPSQSIVYGSPTAETHNISNRENVKAWHVNAETCLAFWVANGTDCATCIRGCPFNKPWGIHHAFVRWAISRYPRANRFFLWMDTFFGYGKKVTPKASGEDRTRLSLPGNESALSKGTGRCIKSWIFKKGKLTMKKLVLACLQITPVILSSLLICAHFLRHGRYGLTAIGWAPLIALLIRHKLSVRLTQLILLSVTGIWIWTTVTLVRMRIAENAPYTRLVWILGTVAAFTFASVFVFRFKTLRKFYKL